MKYYRQSLPLLLSLMLLLLAGCEASSAEVAVQSPTNTPVPLPTATPRPTDPTTATPVPSEPVTDTTFVQWVSDETVVPGAQSTLTRMEHGIYGVFNAVGLEPGDAYTMWWLIFNEPQNCSGGECGPDDAFLLDENGAILRVDGEDQMNWEARAATDLSTHRATGTIIDMDGTAEFRAHLPVGDVTEAVLRGTGLKDPYRAEVHVILRTHGQAQPGNIHLQMNTPWGGCPDGWPKAPPCSEIQFAVHSPPRTVGE